MTDKYHWTQHALYKLKQYQLSRQRIVRVLRNPDRIEEGIVPKTVACMQKAGSQKHPYEIWTMYQIKNLRPRQTSLKPENSKSKNIRDTLYKILDTKIRIISAWRYPGISPKNNPIPEEILNEITDFI